jgi:hypothetical protein
MTQVFIPCPRCNATGFLPQHSHVDNGRCFRCFGSRYCQVSIYFGKCQVFVGKEDSVQVQDYFRMTRRELIDLVAVLLKRDLHDGRTIATLGVILGMVDRTFRNRGTRAFATRGARRTDRASLLEIRSEVYSRWGCLRIDLEAKEEQARKMMERANESLRQSVELLEGLL